MVIALGTEQELYRGKIIDSHVHFKPDNDYFNRIAEASGYENTLAALETACAENNMTNAILMDGDNTGRYANLSPNLRYCLGINEDAVRLDTKAPVIDSFEHHMRSPSCVGIKIFAGYIQRDLMDGVFTPLYELARQYDKPIAIHTGQTSRSNAGLEHCHPLMLDKVAVNYPDITFIMCHFGNPWFQDAAAVLEKNSNVYADLSGILVGKLDVDIYMQKKSGYVNYLKTWLAYVDDYSRFMYGTDWPLCNIGDYIQFISRIIPEQHHYKVFYENAKNVYKTA